MASLPTLLLFCDYLESRLHTSSLALLRRMLTDFFAGNEHTLQDFMRLGASVVSVMPVERKGLRHQAEADRLLTEQKKEDNVLERPPNQRDTSEQLWTQVDTQRSQPPHPCVFHYLAARVATKNILWLRDLFHEFCIGEDTLMREFVRRGDEPITVVPVDVQALRMAPLPPPPLMASTAVSSDATARTGTATLSEMSPLPTLSPQNKRPKRSEREKQTEVEAAADGRTRKKTRRASVVAREQEAELALNAGTTLSEIQASPDEMRMVIVCAVKRLEEKEPWKYAFKTASLVMPFSRAKYPVLVTLLLEFWKANARAVWERKFWSPLSRSRNFEPHTQRRCRQSRAQNFFEKNVIYPVYEELGAAFFVKMDRRAELYSGWYYLDQAVDLFTLAQRCGLPKCLQYIESEASKRFPVAPGSGRNFYLRVNGKSRSMWSSSEALKPVLDEIVAITAED
ncbi:hypothetical protein PRIC1_005944 [Phytophthora ramorum]|nr:hypothetical protein KRP22_4556 [Phytophthora ramorum]